jgi:uncharacterized protein
MRYVKAALVAFAVAVLSVMGSETNAQTCPCSDEFGFLTHYLETNYAGFADKVTPATRPAYQKALSAWQKEANATKTQSDCELLMQAYIAYFKDGHIQLSSKQPEVKEGDTAAMRRLHAQTETLQTPKSRLEVLRKSTGFEGIYTNSDSTYTVAIVSSPTSTRTHAGVILSSKTPYWKPGEVKLTFKLEPDGQYTAMAYMRDHSRRMEKGKWEGKDLLDGNWIKAGSTKTTRGPAGPLVDARPLSAKTFYFRLGTCNPSVFAAVEEFIKKYDSTISQTPNLILDVRGNGGGSDFVYEPLLKYLYDKPVKSYGVQALATPANIAAWEKIFELFPDIPVSERAGIQANIDSMKAHSGKWVATAQDDTTTLPNILAFPKKVVVLQDRHVASSGEQFLLFAKDCGKVTLMGEPSAGVLDYANMRKVAFPCYPMELWYATTRSTRVPLGLGIDNKGVVPAVPFKPGIDAINQAQAYLEK